MSKVDDAGFANALKVTKTEIDKLQSINLLPERRTVRMSYRNNEFDIRVRSTEDQARKMFTARLKQ
eukprot:11901894-Prorocentrum_lima.AAC.1